MTDTFADHTTGLSDPGNRHFLIVPNDEQDIEPRPRFVYCRHGGHVVVQDEAGTVLEYVMSPGERLLVRPVRIMATGTTGTYYGVV